MRKLTCDDSIEVIGLNIRAFYDNIQVADTLPIMEKYGIVDVDPMGWYPARKLLDSLNELFDNPNATSNLVAIGMKVGEIHNLEPGMKEPTIDEVLMKWNDLYQGLHRDGDVGGIKVEQISPTHYKTIHTVLYPDDMSYGILYGYARRFLPKGTRFKVYYDEEVGTRDHNDAPVTIIHIEW